MTDQEILAKFTRILRDLLLDDLIELTMETRREDVPNWDLFNYINFIVAVEMEFGVKFKVADIELFPNVGAIVKETTKMLGSRLAKGDEDPPPNHAYAVRPRPASLPLYSEIVCRTSRPCCSIPKNSCSSFCRATLLGFYLARSRLPLWRRSYGSS